MKGIIIGCILIACAFLSTAAFAQQWPGADDIVAKIKLELNLTPGQLDQVGLIIKENMTKRQNITPQLTQGLTQSQSSPLDEELYTKLSEVLTRDQMGQWIKVRNSMLESTKEAGGSQ